MTVSVDIEVARHNDALTVPLEAVRDVTGTPWVMKIHGGRAVRQDVVLGALGSSKVEVTQGLTDAECVLSATGNAVPPGQHVRVRLLDSANARPNQ